MNLFWRRVDTLPPIACRLLAKHRLGHPLTSLEIGTRCGMTVAHVDWISEQTSWHDVPVGIMRDFTTACGLDFFDAKAMERVRHYLSGKKLNGCRKPPEFEYLRESDQWQTYYRPLLRRWRESLMNGTTR